MLLSMFKAAFPTVACTNRVKAAPIMPEGLVGVTQETRIGRSLAHFILPVTSGQYGVRLVKQFGRGAA